MTSSIAITNNISSNGSPLENSSSVVVGINNSNSPATGKGNDKQLNTIRGPVKTINNNFDYPEPQKKGADSHQYAVSPCKLELDMTVVPVKKEYIDVAMDKDSQYEEDVVMPLPPKANSPININKIVPEINTMIHTQIGRKARIGKSMAREMIHGVNLTAPVAINAIAAMNDTSSKPSLVEMNKVPVKEIKQEDQIKKELTEEDDVVIVEDVNKKEPEIKTEPEVVEISSNGSTPPLEVITTDLSQDSSDVEITSYSPPQSGKRIGILYSNLNPKAIVCKQKSPTNGYKSLIKQTEPKSYLVLSRKSDKKDRFGLLSKSKTVRRRKLVLTPQQRKRLKVQRKKRRALEKSKLVEEELTNENAPVPVNNGRRSALDETIDQVARGYFSEPDTSSRQATARKAKKSKSNEARSKSESKKTTVSSESAQMLISNEQELRRANQSNEPEIIPMEVVEIPDHPNIQEDNNNCIKTNNNVENPTPAFDDFKFIEPRVPPLRLTCSKRRSSRSKFGLKSKKSKRAKYLSAGIDEVIIPRKPDVVPRWNNGWTWEGEPFQRKIFLNVSICFF